MCTIQLWKLDVTLDIRSNLVWIYLILCYPVSRHGLLDIEVILPFLQRWNIFTNDHKGAPLFISLYFYSFFFLSECFIKIRNMLCATISFPGNLEEPHLVWVPWQTHSCTTCLLSAFIQLTVACGPTYMLVGMFLFWSTSKLSRMKP